MPIGAGISAAATVAGAGAQAWGASQAANAQTSASQQAIAAQQQMFNTANSALKPFYTGGAADFNTLNKDLPYLTTPFGATPGSGPTGAVNPAQVQAQLAATPGYQFALNQGLQASQNGFAAQGLGSSGNAMKGAANYAEGLADTTYQQQFQNYLAQNQQNFNLLMGPSQLGAGAAGNLASAAGQAGAGVANSLTGMGNAQAGAYMAGTGAIANGLTGAGNSYLQYNLLNSYLGSKQAASPVPIASGTSVGAGE